MAPPRLAVINSGTSKYGSQWSVSSTSKLIFALNNKAAAKWPFSLNVGVRERAERVCECRARIINQDRWRVTSRSWWEWQEECPVARSQGGRSVKLQVKMRAGKRRIRLWRRKNELEWMKVRHKGKKRRRCGGGNRVGGWWAGFIRMEEHQSRVNGWMGKEQLGKRRRYGKETWADWGIRSSTWLPLFPPLTLFSSLFLSNLFSPSCFLIISLCFILLPPQAHSSLLKLVGI